jgi:hypothetical protein
MRLRDNLVVEGTQAIHHMQKALFEMNVTAESVGYYHATRTLSDGGRKTCRALNRHHQDLPVTWEFADLIEGGPAQKQDFLRPLPEAKRSLFQKTSSAQADS